MARGVAERARIGDRILAFVGFRLVVWLIAAQAFLPGVLFDPVNSIAYYHDEHLAIEAEESARQSYVAHHELPAWDPYFCGGVVALSNSPSVVLAPDFLLRILYGTLAGRRLALLLFVLLGMEGTFRYARANGASAIGAATAAVAFSASGGFQHMLGLGWGSMFQYNLVPWVALCFEKGLRKNGWVLLGGFFVAWLLLGGGTYALPYTIVVLVLLTVIETWRAIASVEGSGGVRWWRPAATFVGIGVVSAGIGAIRLLPLLQLLESHTRTVAQKDSDVATVCVVHARRLARARRLGRGGGRLLRGEPRVPPCGGGPRLRRRKGREVLGARALLCGSCMRRVHRGRTVCVDAEAAGVLAASVSDPHAHDMRSLHRACRLARADVHRGSRSGRGRALLGTCAAVASKPAFVDPARGESRARSSSRRARGADRLHLRDRRGGVDGGQARLGLRDGRTASVRR